MPRKTDQKQNAKIKNLQKAMNALKLKVGKKPKVIRSKPKTNRNGAKKGKAHHTLTHLMRTDHANPVYGLMDTVPTAAVLHRGQTSGSVGANHYFMWMGFLNGGNTTMTGASDAYRVSSPVAIQYNWQYSGAGQYWTPDRVSNTLVVSALQEATSPYTLTNSYKSKLNKASLHLAYNGSQTNMTSTFYVFVDYHGDICKNLTRDSSGLLRGCKLGETWNLIYNHPRTIKVKVDSGTSIDYALTLATAQLTNVDSFNWDDYSDATLIGMNGKQSLIAVPNAKATNDEITIPYQPFVYQQESTGATATKNYAVSLNDPLVYVVGSFQNAAQMSVSCAMDWEYHDESLYSVSKPSVCDSLTASAIHTAVMNIHHEATTTPLHKRGLTFKQVVKKATKAEHVAQAIASSPMGQAVLTAALA